MAQNLPTGDLCIVCNSGDLLKGKYRRNLIKESRKCTRKQRQRLEEEVLIFPQLRALFVLKSIFKHPMKNARELLRRMGNPSEWFEICDSCSNRIDKAMEVQKKLKKLEERFKKIKKGLHETLYNSHLQALHLVNEKVGRPNRRSSFRTEIRKMIPSIYEEHVLAATTAEESFKSNDQTAPEVKTEVISTFETDLMDTGDESYFDLEHVAESSRDEQSGSEDVAHVNYSGWNSLIQTDITNAETVTNSENQQLPLNITNRDVRVKTGIPHISSSVKAISRSSCNPPPKKKKVLPTRDLSVRSQRTKVVKKKLPPKQKRKRKPYYYAPITEVVKKPDKPFPSESQKFLTSELVGKKLAEVETSTNPKDDCELEDTLNLPGRQLLRKRKPVKRSKILLDEDDEDSSNDDESDEDFTIEEGQMNEDVEEEEEYGDEDDEEDSDYVGNVDDLKRPRKSEKIRKRQNIARLKSSVQRAKNLIRNPPESTNVVRSINLSLSRWKRLLDCAHELLDMTLITYPPKTDEEKRKIPERFAESEIGTVRNEHGEKPFKTHWSCNKCSRKFSDARKVLEHLKLHDAGQILMLSCPICKTFTSSSQKKLDRHVAFHQKNVPNPACEICGKSYTTFPNYKHHMEVEHGIKFNYFDKNLTVCEICSDTFNGDRNLKFHQVVNHGHVDEEGLFPICSQCHKPFKSAQCLEMHIQRDHVKAKNFFCDQCGAGYALDCQLKNHIASVHTEATPVTCHVCGFVVSNKRFIKKHMKKQHPEALKMSTDEVEAYVKKLNEEKPHKCKLCDNRFAFSVFLYHHYRKEHEEVTDKYKCSVCGKGYSRACSVKRHYETVHEKKTVICQYCNKEIPISSLYQHQSQTKLCGAKRKAELEAKSSSTVVVKQSTPSSSITAESEINAPFFYPFRDNHQQFENLNQSTGMLHGWSEPSIKFEYGPRFIPPD
ncbi:putative zinc finger protein [Orchesella cincta]|uniref:Putative zinc finger protein n=1 Tax=Orchesella cincta TaxID=48709 RepID=A0A1D2NH54_ORCCI|nr:putative zinc finger protein [Orchesella cincta]